MALTPASGDGEQERGPCLDGPGERGDHHVGPVGVERVERGVERADAALELRNEVLLIAAVVGLRDDLGLGQLAVVGDVEEVLEVRGDADLASVLVDPFPQDDDAVVARGLGGLVLELGGVLGDEALVEVAARLDDLRNRCTDPTPADGRTVIGGPPRGG
jgi:hypothetical protein